MGKRIKFADGEIYHVYNRGTDKRLIFLNNHDRLRFLHGLFVFNDKNSANVNLTDKFNRHPAEMMVGDVQARHTKERHRSREPLVEIISFALMPNHFHLLLRQHAKKGVVRFMHKLGTGYTLYFNQKADRTGCLFQGKFKATHIETSQQLLHVLHYIHANPLDLATKNQSLEKFLENYCWSSHLDYCGLANFPSITQRGFLLKLLDGEENYKKSMSQWIKDKTKHCKLIAGVVIETALLVSLTAPYFLQLVCDNLACFS